MRFQRWISGLLLFCLAGLVYGGNLELVSYYHTDHLGSPVAATDERGELLWREQYRPYGERYGGPGSNDSAIGYTGHMQDDAAGLVYAGARYHDPVIGRFLAVDPAGVMPGLPLSFNRYSYGANNPYKFVDPDGRWAEDAVIATVSIAMSSFSYAKNIEAGNYSGAAVDAGAIVLDAVAVLIPVVPGGVGLAVQGGRAVSAGTATAKKVPNPHGSRGGPAHTSTTERRIKELKEAGHEHLAGGKLPEEVIQTPGGCKSCRRPDITTRAPDGTVYRENVGRSTGSGNPIAREQRALNDINAATGRRTGYTPYDR